MGCAQRLMTLFCDRQSFVYQSLVVARSPGTISPCPRPVSHGREPMLLNGIFIGKLKDTR
jgi:hypothetical protein